MKTIGLPTEDSTRGTWLAERGRFKEDCEPPTYEQRHRSFGELARFSENRYLGRYHTDETIPSPYFDTSITDINGATLREDLFFTYLHSPGDQDYTTMGIGTLRQETKEGLQLKELEGGSES